MRNPLDEMFGKKSYYQIEPFVKIVDWDGKPLKGNSLLFELIETRRLNTVMKTHKQITNGVEKYTGFVPFTGNDYILMTGEM